MGEQKESTQDLSISPEKAAELPELTLTREAWERLFTKDTPYDSKKKFRGALRDPEKDKEPKVMKYEIFRIGAPVETDERRKDEVSFDRIYDADGNYIAGITGGIPAPVEKEE